MASFSGHSNGSGFLTAWSLDGKFRTQENEEVVAFIERKNPSAHDEVAGELINSAKGLPDVQWYCPDKWRYAYVVLHTRSNRIFGIAFGMSGLAFLLPAEMIPEAVAVGGEIYPAIGDQWILWQDNKPRNMTRWCKLAHDYAVGSKAPGVL